MTAARDADRWVVAIGGNALADPRDPSALAHQGERAAELAPALADALAHGKQLVIVHGNGPQVGARLIQNEAAREQVPESPLHVCVAETQGQIGYHLALALTSEIERRGILVPVVCVVTQVAVDPGASEFAHPDKPVGPAYAEAAAQRLAAERGWNMRRVADGGWRRVVASPRPLRCQEEEAVRLLLAAGMCVIAGGGGGVPVANDSDALRGIDAVVDKDYTAERLAASVWASRLVVLTDVPGAALSFQTSGRRYLREMSVAEAREHLAQGEFGPGSMAPKVEACVEFVEAGGDEAVIAATSEAKAAFEGRAGTRIVR